MIRLASLVATAALAIGCAAPPSDDASTEDSALVGAQASPPTTVEGTLFAVPGIPDGPGVAIFSPAGFSFSMLELILDDAERAEFVSGQKAKVTGTKILLPGLDRDGLDVDSMIVCPAAGTWVDCMPGVDAPSKLCAERSWVSDNCRDVRFAD